MLGAPPAGHCGRRGAARPRSCVAKAPARQQLFRRLCRASPSPAVSHLAAEGTSTASSTGQAFATADGSSRLCCCAAVLPHLRPLKVIFVIIGIPVVQNVIQICFHVFIQRCSAGPSARGRLVRQLRCYRMVHEIIQLGIVQVRKCLQGRENCLQRWAKLNATPGCESKTISAKYHHTPKTMPARRISRQYDFLHNHHRCRIGQQSVPLIISKASLQVP